MNCESLILLNFIGGCVGLSKKVDFGGQKVVKKTLRLPNFKGRNCNLDFPTLHESNFAAYFTGCQLYGLEKTVKVEKVDFK